MNAPPFVVRVCYHLPVMIMLTWRRAPRRGKTLDGGSREWLRNDPSARPGHRAAAEDALKDLRNALEGK